MDKHSLRKIMKEKRLHMNQETFSLYSQKITEKVLAHPKLQHAQMIACYVSLPKEVETISLIQELLLTKRVCVPRVLGEVMHFYEIHSLNDLQEGCFHVLEPTTAQLISPDDINLMIVPMLAFDKKAYRVGYGKGYYDKYFSTGYQGYKLGIAFSFQYIEAIEVDMYDWPLDEIMTEI